MSEMKKYYCTNPACCEVLNTNTKYPVICFRCNLVMTTEKPTLIPPIRPIAYYVYCNDRDVCGYFTTTDSLCKDPIEPPRCPDCDRVLVITNTVVLTHTTSDKAKPLSVTKTKQLSTVKKIEYTEELSDNLCNIMKVRVEILESEISNATIRLKHCNRVISLIPLLNQSLKLTQ